VARVTPDPYRTVPKPDPYKPPKPPRAPKPPKPPGGRQSVISYGPGGAGGPAAPPPPPPGAPQVPWTPLPPKGPVDPGFQQQPIAPPPVPAPAAPDFSAYYLSDPRYLQQNPLFDAMKARLYAQFGWVPNGAGGFAQQSTAENPYSVVAQLAKSLQGQTADVQNTNNARGILFSGGTVSGLQGATDNYNKDLYSASNQFQEQVGDVDRQRADLISSLYPDYAEMAGKLGATPPAAPVVPTGLLNADQGVASGSAEVRKDRRQANDSANAALQRTAGVTGLAQLYNQWKGKVDESVLRAIDQKLIAARKRGK
jgi:hypothetical protein